MKPFKHDFETSWFKFRSDDRAWGTPWREIPGSLWRMTKVAACVVGAVALLVGFWKVVLVILLVALVLADYRHWR